MASHLFHVCLCVGRYFDHCTKWSDSLVELSLQLKHVPVPRRKEALQRGLERVRPLHHSTAGIHKGPRPSGVGNRGDSFLYTCMYVCGWVGVLVRRRLGHVMTGARVFLLLPATPLTLPCSMSLCPVCQLNHMLFRLMHTRGEEMEDPALVGSPTLTGAIPPSSAWLTADVLARQGAEVRGNQQSTNRLVMSSCVGVC